MNSFWTDDEYFYKRYPRYDDERWKRLMKIAKILSNANVTPKLTGNWPNERILKWEKIIPLDIDDPEGSRILFEGYGLTSARPVKDLIRIKVAKLRELGYVHADLHINNLGFLDGEFYILDIDTVTDIETERDLPWLIEFMEGDLDIQDFDEYAERDWTGWVDDIEDVYSNS